MPLFAFEHHAEDHVVHTRGDQRVAEVPQVAEERVAMARPELFHRQGEHEVLATPDAAQVLPAGGDGDQRSQVRRGLLRIPGHGLPGHGHVGVAHG